MNQIEIKGLGVSLPKQSVTFKSGTRYRISGRENHLQLLVESAQDALKKSGMKLDEIDAIVGACAVGLQPIPCTAALVHEQLSPKRHIPAFDINSTCTSFISAVDIVSSQIASGKYKNVLIVAGDVPSIALNAEDKHSYELFGDGAVSTILSSSQYGKILYSNQLTYSKGAHMTQIAGGGTSLPSYHINDNNRPLYQFHMEGRKVLKLSFDLIDEMMRNVTKDSGIKLDEIDMIIPHQASPALGLVMKKLGIEKDKYIDIVSEYGNMVSASVPFALHYAIQKERIKRGDKVLLIGTAAGLTTNALLLEY
ncbi:3-oxoacyl-ACP synthase [Lactococcus lactis subsp. lactis]|nr:3-oxoacyl-ACP synthase [Lactococcus lactis subsp. lactis]